MILRLDLGDGEYILSDEPPPAVQAASLRLSQAMRSGHRPRAGDIRVLRLWLAGQEERHGGVRREVDAR